jgi:hypothetical protein
VSVNSNIKTKAVGVTPSIILINPKFALNVGNVIRGASCYGVEQVWWTGDRVGLDIEARGRLPREERMKGYGEVEITDEIEKYCDPNGEVVFWEEGDEL